MNDIPLDLTSLPTDLPYSQNELDRWLNETSAPLSDDEMIAMSAYFDSDSFRHEEEILSRKEQIDNMKFDCIIQNPLYLRIIKA